MPRAPRGFEAVRSATARRWRTASTARWDVDVASVVRLLEASGYQGWYVLEQDVVLATEPGAGEGPAAAAARSIDYLTRIMKA